MKSFLNNIFALFLIFTNFAFVLSQSAGLEICLSAHNDLRSRHQNTGPLTWSNTLASAAQTWAEHLVSIGRLEHDNNKGSGIGENLYLSQAKFPPSCAAAVLRWYGEITNYNYMTGQSENGQAIGHFTQVVWKNTVSVGVGIASKTIPKPTGNQVMTVIVARYSPKGNVDGEYRSQVTPVKGGAITPALHDLDPSVCINAEGTHMCDLYAQYGFGCEETKSGCYKMCTNC